ncbi:BTB/POZ/MATH-domain protein [Rhynchospora pubera]|uniref:BTB/POZ/MATH-domain protein n=1 Tax=Rhynchospora pubera TaxID=906938 RepID=A0AAV8GNP9_9POAL|nr:BTB/POZ/MATH-domain protein [Rhynchospora pubera]
MGSPVTASAVRAKTETGSHLFTVSDYSLIKGIGIGKYIQSDVFTIGGYDWVIRFHPDGASAEDKNFVAFYLMIESGSTDVKAQFAFTVLEQNGRSSDMKATKLYTFNSKKTDINGWGFPKFAKRSAFEVLQYLKNDSFTVKCTVNVMKGTRLQATTPCNIVVPPSNSNQQFARLLETSDGADVTFVVKGERFKAHRCVLAARSAVFKAELFGCMREKRANTITVDDIEASVFKAMLYFIYSDSLPDFEANSRSMAQHLLVAADRYDLERLKLLCEDLLCKNLNVSTVANTLLLAERHNCNQLKTQCLQFMSYREVLKTVALTEAFHFLMKSFPSFLKDIICKMF